MALNKQEIHNIGMNRVGKELQTLGYEFLGVNSELGKHPQFVTYKKNETMNFVLVKTCVKPNNPWKKDERLISKLTKHAKEKEANLWFAAVEISKESDGELIEKEDDILVKFNGFEVIFDWNKTNA